MTWTDAWAEAVSSAPSDTVTIGTLEFIHSTFVDGGGNQVSIRAVNDVVDMQFLLEDSAPIDPGTVVTFTAIPFEIPWPDAQDGQVPKLVIKLDNAGKEIDPFLAPATLVQEPILVIFRVYLYYPATQTSVMGMDPVTFNLRTVKVSGQYVEGEASLTDLQNLQFCRIIYDIKNYPGLTHS